MKEVNVNNVHRIIDDYFKVMGIELPQHIDLVDLSKHLVASILAQNEVNATSYTVQVSDTKNNY
jgi:hypothetical protein